MIAGLLIEAGVYDGERLKGVSSIDDSSMMVHQLICWANSPMFWVPGRTRFFARKQNDARYNKLTRIELLLLKWCQKNKINTVIPVRKKID